MKLKGYSAISTFSGKSGIRSAKYICQFTLLMFILSPVDFFISLVENLLLGLTPEKFLKFNTFPEGVLEVLHVTFKSSGISLKECYGGLLWDVKITSYQWSISCTKRSWMELVLKDNTWEIYTRKLILPGSRNHVMHFWTVESTVSLYYVVIQMSRFCSVFRKLNLSCTVYIQDTIGERSIRNIKETVKPNKEIFSSLVFQILSLKEWQCCFSPWNWKRLKRFNKLLHLDNWNKNEKYKRDNAV